MLLDCQRIPATGTITLSLMIFSSQYPQLKPQNFASCENFLFESLHVY